MHHGRTWKDLFTRMRSTINPDKHPRTAAALEELQIAVKFWADQSPGMPGQVILIIQYIDFLIIIVTVIYFVCLLVGRLYIDFLYLIVILFV